MEFLTADSLEKVGIAGCLALSLYFQYKLVTNHMAHNTRELGKIAEILERVLVKLNKKK